MDASIKEEAPNLQLRRLGATFVSGGGGMHQAVRSHYATQVFARTKAVRYGLEVIRDDSISNLGSGMLRGGTDQRTAAWNARQEAILVQNDTASRLQPSTKRRVSVIGRSLRDAAAADLQGLEHSDTAGLLQSLFEEVRAQIAVCNGSEKDKAASRRVSVSHRGFAYQPTGEVAEDRRLEDLEERINVARGGDGSPQSVQHVPMTVFHNNKLVNCHALERAAKPRSYYLSRTASQMMTSTGPGRSMSSTFGISRSTSCLQKMDQDPPPQLDFIAQNQSPEALSSFRRSRRATASHRWACSYEERSTRASKSRTDLDVLVRMEKSDPKLAKTHMRLAEVALGSRMLPLLPTTFAQIHWLSFMAAALFARKVQIALKKKRAFMSEFEKALGIQAAWRAKRVVFRIKRRKVARKEIFMAGLVILFATKLLRLHRARESAVLVIRAHLRSRLLGAEQLERMMQFRRLLARLQKSTMRVLVRRHRIILKLRELWQAAVRRLQLKKMVELSVLTISDADRDAALKGLLDSKAARKGKKVLAILADGVESSKADVRTWWFPRKEEMENLVRRVVEECESKDTESTKRAPSLRTTVIIRQSSMMPMRSTPEGTDGRGKEEKMHGIDEEIQPELRLSLSLAAAR